MDGKTLASYFDHTSLKADATLSDITQLCNEARTNNFFAVCVNPFWISQCRPLLAGSSVKICTVIGFPLGASGVSSVQETLWALNQGAQEIDCVLNIGALKSQLFKPMQNELNEIVSVTRGRALVKVIVESGILTTEELRQAILAVNASGAEFIKTSTGFATQGATVEAVQMMKELRRSGLKIKASGGIRTAEDAKTYLDLGVDRIGASQSVSIFEALQSASGSL
jgi:deoxyribose-phosphate aldolase